MIPREVLTYGPTVMAWGAAAYKLSALRRSPHELPLRSFSLGLLALALALTMLLPPVYLGFDGLVGVPNLARLLAHSLMMLAAWCIQMFLFYLNYGSGRTRLSSRREVLVLLAALLTLLILFGLSETEEEAFYFTSRYADAPFIWEYRSVLLAYMGLVMANASRLSWRYADACVGRPSLHLGLRLVSLGAALGLGYVVHGAYYLIARRFGIGYPFGNGELVSDTILASCIAMVALGSTMPGWGPRLGIPALHQWLMRYRACRRLYPLWRDLCRAHPQIALEEPRGNLADLVDVRSVGFRLYRRIVEIRDGHLALRSFFDARVAAHAAALCREAGIAGEEAEAVLEAANLAAAMRLKARGKKASESGPSARPPGWADVHGEVRFLGRVAHHYTHSPIVRSAVDLIARKDRSMVLGENTVGVAVRGGERDAPRGSYAARSWRRRLARLVTEVLAPTPTVAALLVAVAWHSAATATEAMQWALVSVLFAAGLPFIYLIRGVRRRHLTDIHVRQREQRPRVLLVGIASVLAGLALLATLGAPRDLVALVAAMAVGLATSTLVTLFWKISVHTAVNSGAVTILVLVFGPGLLALAPAVALVGWSRVEVDDHSPLQTVGGAVLGAVAAAGVFLLLR